MAILDPGPLTRSPDSANLTGVTEKTTNPRLIEEDRLLTDATELVARAQELLAAADEERQT